jgi:hypothetical protein
VNSSTKTGIVWYSLLLLICVIGVGLAARAPERALAAAEPAVVDIRGFHLLSAADGWLWVGQQLYWSHDAGAHWLDITPRNFERAIVRGVFFSDSRHGWLVAIRPDSAGTPTWVLARTPDGGRSWQITALSLFAPDEADTLPTASCSYRPPPTMAICSPAGAPTQQVRPTRSPYMSTATSLSSRILRPSSRVSLSRTSRTRPDAA